MKLGSLFAGIGGFELAAQWAGIEPVWSNEIDHYCCNVLRKNFTHEIIEKDIRDIGKDNLGSVDIISAGTPCQPASLAGKRKGTDDDRWLWDETIRVVSELKPPYVVCENPPGILSLENGKPFHQILYALEDEGYQIELFNIPACSVGAWHRRERIWIVAYLNGIGRNDGQHNNRQDCKPSIHNKRKNSKENDKKGEQKSRIDKNLETITHPNSKRLPKSTRRQQRSVQSQAETSQGSKFGGTTTERRLQREIEPKLGRVVHGVSSKLDNNRITALGNTIDPHAAYEIFNAIKQIANE